MKRMQDGRSSLPLQVTVIILVIAGLAGVLFLPQLLQDTPPTSRILPTAPECDLNSLPHCLATDGTSSIAINFSDNNFHSMKPIPVEVQLGSFSADQVMIDMQGQDMYMGLNQIMLKPSPTQAGLWVGEITLAVCTTGEMTWKTSVITQKDSDQTQADFYFNAR